MAERKFEDVTDEHLARMEKTAGWIVTIFSALTLLCIIGVIWVSWKFIPTGFVTGVITYIFNEIGDEVAEERRLRG